MVEVIWTDIALNDVNDIAEFIANDSEKYSEIQAERFFKAVKVLEAFPESGKIVSEIMDENIRELSLGNYRIIYQLVSPKIVAIITVHHRKRLLGNNPAFH